MTSDGMSSARPPTNTASAVSTMKISARPSMRRCHVGRPSSFESCSAMVPQKPTNTATQAMATEAASLTTARVMVIAMTTVESTTGAPKRILVQATSFFGFSSSTTSASPSTATPERAVTARFHTMMQNPTRYIVPPMRRVQYGKRSATRVSTKLGYCSAPWSVTARHMRPCVMPPIHIETT